MVARPSYGEGRDPEPDVLANWHRYLQVVWRRKTLVAAAAVLGLVAAAVAWRMNEPRYATEATIWIDVTRQSEVNRGPIRTGQLLESNAWVELLRNVVVLEPAVRGTYLYVEPAVPADSALFRGLNLAERFAAGRFVLVVDRARSQVTLSAAGRGTVDVAAFGDSLGRSQGFLWVPPPDELRTRGTVEFTVVHPRDAAVALGRDLSVSIDRGGNFLRVALTGPDPARLANTVNSVVRRFVDVAAELKRDKLTELVRILRGQLQDAAAGLHEAEMGLEDFRVQTITLPSERASPFAPGLEYTEDPAFRNFFDMRIQLEGIRRDRDALARALSHVADSVLSTDAFRGIEAVQQSPELTGALDLYTTRRADLRSLLQVYTPEHPQVRRLAEEVRTLARQTVPALGAGLENELAARAADLESRLASASHELQQIPPRRIQEARLERDVEIQDKLYTMLQQRYEEARLAEASSIPDVQVMAAAVVPQKPVGSPAIVISAAMVAAGVGLGILLALLADRMDRRVRYPQHVSQDMGLMILGVVPHVRHKRNGRGEHDLAVIVEAFRGIRLNLTHAHGAAGPMIVTVTSPGSADGKSFVSSNLALSFADTGQRTLLIDADSRRGSLHRVISRVRKPGLTDCLAGRAASASVIQHTDYPRLDFVGGGTRVPGAPELLGGPRMMEFIAEMRSAYDVIIVDSPPLGAGVDAYTLGTVTGSAVLVLRTGQTNREEAEAKLDVLDRLPVRLLGAILNDARDQSAYGYGYYSYYMPGYEYEVEPAEVGSLPSGEAV
jgi:capsular exopolysaccharide synthesis family protein